MQPDGKKPILPEPGSRLREERLGHICISFLSRDLADAFSNDQVVCRPLTPKIYRTFYLMTFPALRDIPTVQKLVRHVQSPLPMAPPEAGRGQRPILWTRASKMLVFVLLPMYNTLIYMQLIDN